MNLAAKMSRRKQAKPMKRVMEAEEEETVPETKSQRLEEPSTSKDPPKATPVPAHPPTSALKLLENSLKKFEPSKPPHPPGAPTQSSGSLGALFNCIGKISSSASPPETDSVTSILKCLQCGLGFPAMEQLVKHMQETKHFSNLPKPYSNMMQLDRQRLFNAKLQAKSESMKLACLKCGEVPPNMDQHLRDVHDISKKSDWLRNVQVISGLSPQALQSSQLKQLMSLINTVAKQ